MALSSLVRGLKGRFPGLHGLLKRAAHRYFARRLGFYPRVMGNEVGAVAEVLRGAKWNMAYGEGLAHERLEAEFADYIGVPHAIAVNTGGMALQMSMRALGLKPGHEVLLQLDTCSATAFAVMNAGCTPIFTDISPDTFMLPKNVAALASSGTGALIATHMWGNPEDMELAIRTGHERGIPVIEDACLALGAQAGGKMTGAVGTVGVFSFGCMKPIQGGEGGMIVTHDAALAKELRSLRHWGDRTIDFGVRDTTQLAWNGRMSEIIAAVVREQLKAYPAYLKDLRSAVADFARFLDGVEGIDLVLGNAARLEDCAFTQVVVRYDERKTGLRKQQFRDALAGRGVPTWHANFEAINSLAFFRDGSWRDWILAGDVERATANYADDFPVCRAIYAAEGLGFSRENFLSSSRLRALRSAIADCLSGSKS